MLPQCSVPECGRQAETIKTGLCPTHRRRKSRAEAIEAGELEPPERRYDFDLFVDLIAEQRLRTQHQLPDNHQDLPVPATTIARMCGVDTRSAREWRERGIPERHAETLCHNVGVNLQNVDPDLYYARWDWVSGGWVADTAGLW